MKRPPDTKRTTQNHHITPRPSRAKEARTGRGAHTFLHHIRALSKPGTGSGFSRVSFARGSVRPLSGRNAQRVIVKARVVRINAAIGTKAVSAHINYLVRDGVGMDGEDPTLFTHSGGLEAREVRAWINEGAEDRHQFRFIVSPENADQLDLAQYTKDLLRQMTRDLKTNLNWIAVTHHDTDNPHVHIVLRGIDENGGDLVISRDYLSRGLRAMAQDLATRELGLRTEFELHQQQAKQLTQDRLTPLDQQLEKAADPRQRIDVRKPAPRGFDLAQQHRQRKLIRLRHLAALGLAEEVSPGLWQVDAALTQKLRALGNRNDILKTMHQKLRNRGETEGYVIFDKDQLPAQPMIGQVVHKGLVDELRESKYLLLAAEDGKTYYVALSRFSEPAGLESPPGAIATVSVTAQHPVTPADKNIAAFARNHGGHYDAAAHEQAAATRLRLPAHITPTEYVARHVKRLDALARRGLVEPGDSGRWRIPDDLLAKLNARDGVGRDTGNIVSIKVDSYLSLNDQINAPGPTWLDGELVRRAQDLSDSTQRRSPFQREKADALQARFNRLQQMGMVEANNTRLKASFIDDLYRNEMHDVQQKLSSVYGNAVTLQPGQPFTGTLEKITRLSSGPHAVIRAGGEFTVIPWQQGMERLVPGQTLRVERDKQNTVPDPTRPTLQQQRIRFATLAGVQKTLGLGISL